jgi:hypothetical protein
MGRLAGFKYREIIKRLKKLGFEFYRHAAGRASQVGAGSLFPPSPEFELLALSPVCPLGTNSAAARVNQDWSVATARNTEVVSDSTGVLALECALRRRELLRVNARSAEPVRLAATHRLLRAQSYKDPNLSAHFSLLALCSAARSQGGLRFELAELALHIRFYLRALRAYLGSAVPLHLTVTDFRPDPSHQLLEAQLLTPIRAEFEGVDCAFDDERTAGQGYYLDLCFHIYGTAASGRRFLLVDGGCVDWTQKYLSNRKERLVTSGIGSERVCGKFGS